MLEKDLRTWWEGRPADQRGVLTEAAATFRMDAHVLEVLDESGCPLGPAEKFKHGRKYLWPEVLRRVILEGADDQGP